MSPDDPLPTGGYLRDSPDLNFLRRPHGSPRLRPGTPWPRSDAGVGWVPYPSLRRFVRRKGCVAEGGICGDLSLSFNTVSNLGTVT